MRAVGCFLLLGCCAAMSCYAEPGNYVPPKGYVPDAATAIKIAVAVWEPIYGREHIEQMKPFEATLHNGVWRVIGSLPHDPNINGGLPLAEISKKDGRILRVIHGK
jgi:hypothetical protein